MASSIDISSNALLLIGDEPINSFTEPGAGAQAAANLYPSTKTRLLSTHPWTFALKNIRLSRLTAEADPLTDYKYQYQIPTDLIRLWSIQPHANYAMIGDLILSNENDGLLATYVFDVAEAAFPAHFIKALEYMLAAEMAISVTEDTGKAQLYEQKARDAASQARNIDSSSKPQLSIVDSPFVSARLGNTGPFGGRF